MRFSIPQLMVIGFLTAILWKALYLIISFRRNLKRAKSTGLPIVVAPLHPWADTTRFLAPMLNALLKKLPPSLVPQRKYTKWLEHISMSTFATNREGQLYPGGGKSYLIVAPGKDNILITRDSRLSAEVFSRRSEFVKPLDEYGAIDIYGRNVVSVEGDLWKLHRRIVGPPFNAKNDNLVWRETLQLTQLMLKDWSEQTELGLPISTLNTDTERLALFIISRAGFGIQMNWPSWKSRKEGLTDLENEKNAEETGDKKSTTWTMSHKLDFDTTMAIVNTSIIPILIIPHWILKYAPSKTLNRVYDGFVEFKNYMGDMIEGEKKKMQMNKKAEADLISNIIRASYDGDKNHLSKQEIFGNTFIMLIAGHETTAHTLHYTILKLAQNPSLITEFQNAVQARFSEKPLSEWKYPEDFDSFEEAVAVMYETLRLYPPLQEVLKRASRKLPALKLSTSDGMDFMIPPGTNISMDAVNIHRSTEHWGKDALEYRPSRWLVDSTNGKSSTIRNGRAKEPGEIEETTQESANSMNSSARLYRPPKGHFFPFSEGARACLGRKFALVEFAAVMGVLFRDHSVELDIFNDDAEECLSKGKNKNKAGESKDETAKPKRKKGWILDGDIAKYGETEAMRMAYDRKSAYVESVLNRSTAIITMKPPDDVTLRWVPKGQEVWRKWA